MTSTSICSNTQQGLFDSWLFFAFVAPGSGSPAGIELTTSPTCSTKRTSPYAQPTKPPVAR